MKKNKQNFSVLAFVVLYLFLEKDNDICAPTRGLGVCYIVFFDFVFAFLFDPVSFSRGESDFSLFILNILNQLLLSLTSFCCYQIPNAHLFIPTPQYLSSKVQLTSQPPPPNNSLLNPVLASPQAVITESPALPTICPRSTITTTIDSSSIQTIDEPACPTVTVPLFRVPVPCPQPPSTLICNCPLEPATSTITYGCAGNCCPEATPTVTKAPKLGCPTGCAAVCAPPETTTVTTGC